MSKTKSYEWFYENHFYGDNLFARKGGKSTWKKRRFSDQIMSKTKSYEWFSIEIKEEKA